MGSEMSAEERERREKWKQEALDRLVKKISEGPNLRVNDRIKRFTDLDASQNLRKHYETRKMEAGDHAPDWMKNLAEKLGALTPAPELAGLGALAIAVLIDIESSRSSSTEDALKSVFAEEKASEVWDQIDECLKRYRMNIKNKDELVRDMRRIECQLSAALTKLKNSMLRDGHMSSEALKVWVNGAAFHIQMLIHLVRLGGSQTSNPIKELISIYKNDLDPLFEKHREMISGKCRVSVECLDLVHRQYYLVDEESKEYKIDSLLGDQKAHFKAYYDHRYGRQKRDIHQYFSDVGQNLQELIDQKGSLISTEREADRSEFSSWLVTVTNYMFSTKY